MTDEGNAVGYEAVARLRERLAVLITRTDAIHTDISGGRLDDIENDRNEVDLSNELSELRRRVEEDTFTVLVAGEMKVGKSTSINAMLGRKVLPAFAIPTTAVLSVVGWGDEPAARLYRLDPDSSTGVAATPHPIHVEELEAYVVINHDNRDATSPWGKAEIDWPLPLCRNRVEVVDSPGLNEHPERTKVTMSYLRIADAVIFVTGATAALNESERHFIHTLVNVRGYADLFVLVNRINQVEENERDRVRRHVRSSMYADFHVPSERVFFIDAKTALTAREAGDAPRLAASALPEFETALEKFLSTEKARLKVAPPTIVMQTVVRREVDSIDRSVQLLDQDVEQLRAAYEAQRKPFEQADQQRRAMVGLVGQTIDGIRVAVEGSARQALLRAAENCPEWASSLEREKQVKLRPFNVESQVKEAVEEISTGLSVRIQEHMLAWQRETLTPLLEDSAGRLDRDIGVRLEEFTRGLENIRLSVTPSTGQALAVEVGPSKSERILSGIGGLLLGPGAALIGARFGFKELMRNALPQLGVVMIAALAGLGPLGLLALLVGSGVVSSLFRLNRVNEMLVNQVAAEVAKEVRNRADEQARKIVAEVSAGLDPIRIELDNALGAEIADLKRDVERAMADLTKGKDHAARRKVELAGHRTSLGVIGNELADILKQVVR